MPDIGQPSASDKNSADEIRDGVVTDATRFPGGFIDQQITESGAPVQIVGQFQLTDVSFIRSFDVSPQDGRPRGIAFKPDGNRLYLAGNGNDNVYQYSLSTDYDISTASFVQSLDVSPQDTRPRGLAFKPDGSRLYISGGTDVNVYQYSLSTDYDISTASFDQSFDTSGQDTLPQGLALKPDGTRLYVIGTDNDNVYQYGLSTAYDISTASFVQSFDVSPQDPDPRSLAFKPDGSQLYVSGTGNDNVYQYSLSTDYDISTASFNQALDVSPQIGSPFGLAFKPDGTHLYVDGSLDDNVYQYAVGFIGGELG